MEIIIAIAIIVGLGFIIKLAISDKKEAQINTADHKTPSTPAEEVSIPSNADGYFYYEMVGMYYHGVTPKDFGIFKGKAIAETNNPNDKFAVGIYRDGDNKLVGYIPKDFRGISNEKIHKEITESGGSREVVFKISGSEKRCYGTVYIKNE